MTDTQDSARPWVGAVRLALGLAQGVALWLLKRSSHAAWADHGGGLWAALLLLALFLPLIPMAALGRMRGLVLAAWTGSAAVLLVLLALYDVWRALPEGGSDPGAATPSTPLLLLGAAMLYMIHHLIEPADEARRWRPPYAAYVDTAWRHGFQLVLSFGFVLILWGVLALGGALFDAIGVKPLAAALGSAWLDFPLLGCAFAYAVHRTDISPGMIEGVRGTGLTLLAWLLLVATPLVGLFLLALPFTGLQPLWDTKRSAMLLLSTAATLIVLINAAYQDGRGPASMPAALRWAGRIAGLLLPLPVALATWGLLLRVGQYGLSQERAGGLALCAIGAVYAVGYAWAAVLRGTWLRPLESVNVAASIVGIVLILLVLSPVADPARLAANDQVARLRSGAIPAARFDFAALQFKMARFGRDAIVRLARSADPLVADHARGAQAQAYYGDTSRAGVGQAFSQARIRPEGAVLPPGFRDQDWSADELGWNAGACLVSDQACDLFVIDLDGDGSPEVVAMSETGDTAAAAFKRGSDGVWRKAGTFIGRENGPVRAAIVAGQVAPTAPLLPDLRVGPARLTFQPDSDYQKTIEPTRPPGPNDRGSRP